MNNDLLSSSQLSRLADVPVNKIIKAATSGALRPTAVNRISGRRNYFFKPSDVRQAKALFVPTQPIL